MTPRLAFPSQRSVRHMTPQAIAFHQFSLSSFDPADLEEAVRRCRLRIRLLAGGRFTFAHRRLSINNLTLDSAMQTLPLLVTGSVTRDHVLLGASPRADASLRLNGRPVGEGDVQLYSNASDMDIRSPVDWHWVALQLPRAQFESVVASRIGGPLEPRRSAALNFVLDPTERRHLASEIEAAFTVAARSGSDNGHPLAAQLEERIIGAFMRAIASAMPSGVVDCVLRPRRAAILRRAERYLRDRPAKLFSSQELCDAVSLGERAIEKLFRETHGLTPRQWHFVHRLNGARNDLLHGRLAEVSEIAANWGFFQPGRFAVHYRRLFAESPRVTLQRRRRSHVTVPTR